MKWQFYYLALFVPELSRKHLTSVYPRLRVILQNQVTIRCVELTKRWGKTSFAQSLIEGIQIALTKLILQRIIGESSSFSGKGHLKDVLLIFGIYKTDFTRPSVSLTGPQVL